MKAETKRSLITTGSGVLGAVAGGLLAGNPMLGFKAGSALGTLASGAVQEDEPLRVDRLIHPYISPMAQFSTAKNMRPITQTTWEEPKGTAFDNIMPLLGTIAGPLSTGLMGGVGSGTAASKAGAKAVPSARKGTFIPPDAPTHEEGGVDVVSNRTGEVMAEAEGNEYIIPGDHVDAILNSQNYEEIGIKFMAEVERLKQKGMSEFKAEDGLMLNSLLQPNLYGAFNSPRPIALHDPQTPINIPQGIIAGTPILSPEMITPTVSAAAPTTPITTNVETQQPQRDWLGDFWKNQMAQPNLNNPTGLLSDDLNLFSPNTPVQQKTATRREATPDAQTQALDEAIELQKRINRQGNMLRFSQGLVNLRGLMQPMRPSRPMTLAPFDRLNLDDPTQARLNQIDRELGIGLEAVAQLSPTERIAAMSGLMGNYNQAVAQTSDARTQLMNRQAEINAEIGRNEQLARLDLEGRNREVRAQEAAMKHARNQIGLSGISDAVTGMIESSGQAASNITELEMIKNILAGAKTEEDRARMLAMLRGYIDPQ